MIPQYEPHVRLSYIWSVVRGLLRSKLSPGDLTQEFEQFIATTLHKEHVFATTSGTMALWIALRALDLPEGSTVLFPTYTFIAGANAARMLGYNVALIDVNRNTMCMDPKHLRGYLAEYQANAVIFVDHNGYAGNDLRRVYGICKRAGIPLIEDACQAIGTSWATTGGDIATLSFSVPKLVTTGQGGAVMTRNSMYASRIKAIMDHGGGPWRSNRRHVLPGLNLRFNDILAAYGVAQMRIFSKLLDRRFKVYKWYADELGDRILWPDNDTCTKWVPYYVSTPWMVIYRTPRACAGLYAKMLGKYGIQATQYYRPIKSNTPFKYSQQYPQHFPSVADTLWGELLYLPSSLTLTKRKVHYICHTIRMVGKWLEDNGLIEKRLAING